MNSQTILSNRCSKNFGKDPGKKFGSSHLMKLHNCSLQPTTGLKLPLQIQVLRKEKMFENVENSSKLSIFL